MKAPKEPSISNSKIDMVTKKRKPTVEAEALAAPKKNGRQNRRLHFLASAVAICFNFGPSVVAQTEPRCQVLELTGDGFLIM
jgi:hypothetical protein